MSQLMYDATAAAGYERGFARISSHFVPFLLQAGRVGPGQRILDVEASLDVVCDPHGAHPCVIRIAAQ